MKTKATKVFKEFGLFRPLFGRIRTVSTIAVATVSLVYFDSTRAFADPIVRFFLEFPTAYVQAGLEVNAEQGSHPFIDVPVPPPVPSEYWEALPAELTLVESTVGHSGSSVHIYAPHAGEDVPSTTWSYDIAVQAPSGFGAAETRIRESVAHPGGEHVDAYMAVVGALSGTVPGASLQPRRVIIGGSIGRHTDSPPPPGGPQPIYGGGDLTPRSGLPSPVNQDFPAGELLTIVDPISSQLTMMAMIDGVQNHMISNVYLRNGQNGPIQMDLRPLMQMQQLGDYGSLLTIPDAVIPQHVVQMIAAGNAYVSVGFPASIHPDGAIGGAVSLVQAAAGLPGDYNKNKVVDAGDYALWRKTAGQSGIGLAADGNGDGHVDALDRDVWRQHFGETSTLGGLGGAHASVGIAVPEPVSALLMVVGIALGFCRRRRGNSQM